MGDLRLRRATKRDGPFLLAVRNLPEVRANSKNQCVVSEATHETWLRSQLKNPRSVIWILKGKSQPEGYVRAQETTDGSWLLSIGLDEPFRGKGHGSWAIWEACRRLTDEHGASRLMAEVLSTNTFARRLFETAGFVQTVNVQEGDLALTRFELNAAESSSLQARPARRTGKD